MKVRDILDRIDGIAPFGLAEEWDNPGLMVGDPQWEIQRLGLSLDPLPEAVEEACRKGCQALLSHHPLFLKPIRNLDLSASLGKTIQTAIQWKIAVLSAHTNWDKAEGGLNRVLAEKLGLGSISPLVPAQEGTGGLGALGALPSAAPLREILERLKKAWNLTWLDYYGPRDCRVLWAALCGGSGGGFWIAALAAKADLYVTADMKYHDILDCVRSNLPVAVADHAEMESAALDALARRLAVPGELETVPLDCRGLTPPLRL